MHFSFVFFVQNLCVSKKSSIFVPDFKRAQRMNKIITVVAAVIFDAEGRIFATQRGYGEWKDWWEFPGGKIEPGETPEQGARRELLEETGYGGGTWQEIMTIGQNPSTCTNWTHCFLATGVEKLQDQHLDRTEDIDVLLLSRNEVLQMLNSGQLKQALMLAPLWRYFAQLGECNVK